MHRASHRLVGCNVIDPLLQVKGGEDYTLEITERSLLYLKELEHDAVEFSHACHWDEEQCLAVRGMTRRIGLMPWSLHAWCGGDVLNDEDAAETARRLLGNARIHVGGTHGALGGACLRGAYRQTLERVPGKRTSVRLRRGRPAVTARMQRADAAARVLADGPAGMAAGLRRSRVPSCCVG